MKDRLRKIKEEAISDIKSLSNLENLENIRIKYMGKKKEN